MKKFLLLFFILLNTVCYPVNKLSFNVFGFLMLGDLNIGYETTIGESISLITTGHLISTDLDSFDNPVVSRISSGLRFYEKTLDADKTHSFIELKLGCFFTDNSTLYPTAEIFYGSFTPFNKKIFWDYKVGLLRVLSSDTNVFYPSGAVNLGFYLN